MLFPLCLLWFRKHVPTFSSQARTRFGKSCETSLGTFLQVKHFRLKSWRKPWWMYISTFFFCRLKKSRFVKWRILGQCCLVSYINLYLLISWPFFSPYPWNIIKNLANPSKRHIHTHTYTHTDPHMCTGLLLSYVGLGGSTFCYQRLTSHHCLLLEFRLILSVEN